MHEIRTPEDWEKALVRSQESPIVVYKHSTTCAGCERAFSEMKEGVEYKEIKSPVYFLTIQEARDLSDRIAEDLMIEHESPQAIIVTNRRACYHSREGEIHLPEIVYMLNLIGDAYKELTA